MEEIKVSRLNLNGVEYRLGKQVYDEIGIGFERFVEVLDRDAYTPVLPSAPDAYTLTYMDTDESECDFRIGQACVYPDPTMADGWGVAMLKAIEDGLAVWQDMRADMQRLQDVERVASQAYSNAQLSVEFADEAKNVAEAARNAVATLEGLANTDEAQQTLAAQVTQIAQNTTDIAQMKETLANNMLSIEMTEDGDVNVLTGEGNTMFHDGYIEDSGEVVLELIY